MADNELRFILRMRDEATAILKAHGMAVGDAGGKHQEAARNAKAHGDALSELGKKAKEATEAVTALWTANELAKKSLEAFNEYEQGMIRIARTTQMAGQAMQDFQVQFDNMARQTKGANVESLLEFATVAGQLGIRGSQDILKFSETLGKLGAVTNITGEAGAKQFGRLLLLTGEGAGGVKKLADSLAGLQADTKASAAEILRMGSQLSQTTAGFKLGTAEITGMAAAATQLNIEPFLLSNAVGRSLRALKDGTLNATAGIRDLTTMLGTNRAEFLKLIDTHPEQAMLKFLNVIRALQANGQSVTGFLQKFQLQGDESQKVLLTLAKNVDEVNSKIKESQDLQSGAGKNGLDAQYKGFAESLQAELSGLQTAWNLFAKDLGKALSPAVKGLLQDFTDLLKAADDLFNALPDVGQKIAAWAAIGIPALFGLNSILKVFGTSLLGVGGRVLGLAGSFTTLSDEARAAAAGVAAVEAELAAGKGLGGAAAGGGLMGKLGKGVGVLSLFGLAYEGGHAFADAMNQLFPEATDAIGQWRHNLWKKMTGVGQTSMTAAELMGLHDRKANTGQGASDTGHAGSEDKPSELGKVNPVFELSDDNRQALEHFDQYTKRLDDLKKAQGALEALKEGSKKGVAGQGDTKTDAEISAIQKAIELEMRALDPMNKLRDAWTENLAAARAYSKEQQNQYEIAKAIAEQARTNPRFTQKDADEIRSRMSEVQDANRTKSFREQAITMAQQLQIAAALTQADKDRLEIDQQIAALAKDKGFTEDQLSQLRDLLTLIKQTTEATSQFKSLNPQGDALVNYNAQLKLLNDRLKAGTISQAEFNREKTKLDNDTLAARNPIGAIVQSQQEELQQLQVAGKYREADLKTLQQITELKKQGVISDDASGRAIEKQLGANNRMIQDIKDMQGELNSLTESFGSGLSTAIGQALNGQKYAFQKFAASMGQKMMDMAFTNLARQMEPSVNGLLGGMFGQAKAGTDALSKLAKDQTSQTMATAEMTVQAANVTITSAQGLINGLQTQAGLTGASAPATALSNVPASAASAVGNAPSAAAAAALSAVPKLTGIIGNDVVSGTITQPWVGTSITKALGDPVKELAKAGEAIKAVKVADKLPPMKPYNPNAPLPDGLHGMFGDKASDGIPITDWRVKMAHPEVNGAALQNGIKDGLARLKDGLGFGKKAQAGRVQSPARGDAEPGVPLPPTPPHAQGFANYGGGLKVPQASVDKALKDSSAGMNQPYTGGFTDVAAARAYLSKTAYGNAAARPDDIAKLNPEFATKLASSIQEARSKGLQASVSSGARPPSATLGHGQSGAFDQAGYSLHPVGMATDVNIAGGNYANSPQFQEWAKIAEAHGLHNPYGIGNPREYNHWQAIPDRNIDPKGPLQQFYRDGSQTPERKMQMWEQEQKQKLYGLKAQPDQGLAKKGVDMSPTGSIKPPAELTNVSELAKKAQEQMQASQKALADSLKQTTQQTAGSLTGLQTGIAGVGEKAMSAVPDMSQFGNSISQMISKLGQGGGGGMGGFGGLFGGGGGGFGDMGGFGDFMAFHSGGLVGSTNTGMFRSVSSSVFAGAPRFHTGLGDDEFPAILQKGERVLTRDQDTRASALMARMSDRLASTHAGESQAPARPNGGHRVVMNIQTKDASSFRYSQPQIMAQAHAGISRAAAKNH